MRIRGRAQSTNQLRGAVCGLGAAALFGMSAPVSKVLLTSVQPVLLAGLLYLGAAMGLWLLHALKPTRDEAHLQARDRPKLALIVLAGGLVAPILMLLGLGRVSALSGSLLLNLEAPFTVLLALSVFGEHLGRAGIIASGLIVLGAGLLKLQPGALGADVLGALLLAAACACWALDNNLTQRLSWSDPFALVRVKTLAAGSVNTALGLYLSRGSLPDLAHVCGALLLGSLSYGVSVVLDAYALRWVGAAREAAYFATAPFAGALIAILWLGEPLQARDGLAMFAMGLGVVFLLRERHAHVHTHEALEHDHVHVHDEHHNHAHPPGVLVANPHSHVHRHAPLVHDHPHVSDVHHRHKH